VQEVEGNSVGIMGEPGIGKSRLCYEFTRTHSDPALAALEASATSYDRVPYLPVIDLLKAYFQLDARDDLQTIRDKVTDKPLLALEATLQPILSALLVLLEVPVEDPQWQALIRPNVVSASWKP
jgi:hypothetical protein